MVSILAPFIGYVLDPNFENLLDRKRATMETIGTLRGSDLHLFSAHSQAKHQAYCLEALAALAAIMGTGS